MTRQTAIIADLVLATLTAGCTPDTYVSPELEITSKAPCKPEAWTLTPSESYQLEIAPGETSVGIHEWAGWSAWLETDAGLVSEPIPLNIHGAGYMRIATDDYFAPGETAEIVVVYASPDGDEWESNPIRALVRNR